MILGLVSGATTQITKGVSEGDEVLVEISTFGGGGTGQTGTGGSRPQGTGGYGRISFVFQQFNLLPTLNTWRNVELPLVYGGVARAARRERTEKALTRVGLADRLDHRPGELSGGQQQRVSVARALVTDPDLILADEPTGALDSVSTADLLTLFDELHEQGRTIVLITHEREVAERAHRVVTIRDGRLAEGQDAALAAAVGGLR